MFFMFCTFPVAKTILGLFQCQVFDTNLFFRDLYFNPWPYHLIWYILSKIFKFFLFLIANTELEPVHFRQM